MAKYNCQYKPININELKRVHDRFLILDDKDSYLIGASLKDLGKKVFGFAKMDVSLVMQVFEASRLGLDRSTEA